MSKSTPHSPADKSKKPSPTHHVDIAQAARITSNEPLIPSPRKIDSIKKALVPKHDRGYLSDDSARITAAKRTDVKSINKSAAPLLPRPRSATPSDSSTPSRILFYHVNAPYYGFTNFSPDPVEYKGKRYPTSEHLFQSLKFLDHRPELAEHIRTCSDRPRMVFDETHRFNPEVRPDWLKVRVQMMDVVLWHKFTQNKRLKDELLGTGDAELVEDSDKDAFWGVGPDGKGQNQLGKALVRLRSELRKPSRNTWGDHSA
ncbi:hypothetical protein BJ138DRAFT_1153451 [Hygrophoropsis aurantiaca]|uniref:Uncharacterized protein n=1 Tax=Hygrophoropsis aurantiaca TaxID=72124 RepID=A0ACB8ABV7_9AGAM|nr:hypothetical protein BJ138DRAFT_1153451 [Hygrophoropsis aurantiaca]